MTHRLTALSLLLTLAACSLTTDTFWELEGAADPAAAGSELRVEVSPALGLLEVQVVEVVTVPPSGELRVREAEVDHVIPYDVTWKLLALPCAAGALVVTPLALVFVPPLALAGGKVDQIPTMIVWGPRTAGAMLCEFAWFFQPLGFFPDQTSHAEFTGEERERLRTGLAPGRYSIPLYGVTVRARYPSGVTTETRTTTSAGRICLPVPDSERESGAPAEIDLALSGVWRTVRPEVFDPGAVERALPPRLPLPAGCGVGAK